jgi:hypothetical protein
LRIAVALAVLAGLGDSLVALLVRRLQLYWFERAALAFLVGTAAMSGTWLMLSPLYGAVRPAWALTAFATMPIVAVRVWVVRDRDVPAREISRPANRDSVNTLLSIIIATEFLILGVLSLRTPLGWDGLFNFEIKARLIFENTPSGRFPMAYLSDATRAWSHPQYPLMLPFAEYWIYAWLGRVDQTAIKVLFPLFYLSLIALSCGTVRRITGSRLSLLTGVALGLLPPLTLLPGAVSGYAEVPLAAAFVGAVGFALIGLRTANTDAWILAGVLSAIATWTKAEGTLLACCLAVTGVAAHLWSTVRIGRAPMSFIPAASLICIPLAAVAPWVLVQQRYGIPSTDFLPLTLGAVRENITRLGPIFGVLSRELLRPGHWGLIWPACAAAFGLVVANRRATENDWFLAGTVLLPLLAYQAIFMWSAWSDPVEHAALAVPRLLVPLAPVALISAMLTLHNGYSGAR